MSETPAAESNGAELTALDKKIIRQIEVRHHWTVQIMMLYNLPC